MKKYLLLASVTSLLFFTSCSKDDSPSVDEQLAIDESIIDDFLRLLSVDAEIHESGIRYLIHEEGTGESPTTEDAVIVKYTGTFLNGQTFDQSDIGVNFNLGNLIEAWKIMIPTMKEGGRLTMFAPSVYCYGASGNSSVPPNTPLIFEVELISIVKSFEEQLAIDTEIIDTYLTLNRIDAETHESGIRYVTTVEGDGISPTADDNIQIKYKGTYMDDTVFDESTVGATFPLSGLIDAWKIMLPIMKEGGEMIIYAPSGYCYGPNNVGTIPPNSILIFEIELVAIK